MPKLRNTKTVTGIGLFIILWLYLINCLWPKPVSGDITSDDILNDATIQATPVTSPGPTPIPKSCNAYCSSNSDCGGSLNCYFGYCRNPSCLNETDCDCGAPATITPIPSIPGASPFFAYPTPPGEVPAGKLIIYGWGPAKSRVKLTGIAVSENTVAASDGYFEFKNLYFPTILSYLIGNLYPELCLTATDFSGRATYPVCIPALPLGSASTRIGPVILPPTISLEKGSFANNNQVKASGVSIPSSSVEIYLARKDKPKSFFSIIKDVFAYYIPTYRIESDKDGYFEFNLPNDSPEKWRVFAASRFENNYSPKSNTLTFEVVPFYLVFLNRLWLFLTGLGYNIIYIVILLLLLIIIYFTHLLRKNPRRLRSKKHTTRK